MTQHRSIDAPFCAQTKIGKVHDTMHTAEAAAAPTAAPAAPGTFWQFF